MYNDESFIRCTTLKFSTFSINEIEVYTNMNHLTFVWDENKNRLNQIKHKMSFEEAKTVFFDEHARLIIQIIRKLKKGLFCLGLVLNQEL